MINKTSIIRELSLTILAIILLLLLINPLHLWMPSQLQMYLVLVLVLAVLILGLFFIREKVQDEREAQHRSFAGRIAFLSGSLIALIGIVVQSLNHNLDTWLLLTLGVMVAAKFLARFYSDSHH